MLCPVTFTKGIDLNLSIFKFKSTSLSWHIIYTWGKHILHARTMTENENDDGELAYTIAEMKRALKWFEFEPDYEEEIIAMCQFAEFFDVCESDNDENMSKEEKLDPFHRKDPLDALFNDVTCANHHISRRASQALNKFKFKDVPEAPNSTFCSRKTGHRIYPGETYREQRVKAIAQVNLDAPAEGTALVKLQPTDMESKKGHEIAIQQQTPVHLA